jgi:diguanylate cyclase (GGDEF)-like protein
MRSVVIILLLIAGSAAQPADEAGARLAPSIDQRIQTCIEAEDAEPEHAITLANSVLDATDTLSLAQRAEALGCRGWSQAMLSRRDDARRDAHALRSLLEQYPRTPDRVRLTRRAGSILHRSGDRVGAVDLYAKALADSEAQSLDAERIPLLINLGVLHSEFEEHERARVNYEQALALMDRLGDHRHEAPVRYNLGLNLAGQQRHAEAVPHLQRTLELVRSTGVGGPMQEVAVTVALASALAGSGELDAAQLLVEQVRAATSTAPLRDNNLRLQLLQIEASRLAAAGDPQAALDLLDDVATDELNEIQHWQLLNRQASLQEGLGHFEQATQTLRRINALRESYLRHQNHERLSALEAHLRDREQRQELERLQVGAELQDRRLAATTRLQWATVSGTALMLLVGSGVLLWQRRMNRRLDQASRTDPLTGLANRRDMAQRLRALSQRGQTSAAVLLIDIDLFKQINDDHGHDVGDEVLIAFARGLRAGVEGEREAGVARWGGEEFLLVLPHADRESTRALAETLRIKLARPLSLRSGSVQVGASIGYANLPLSGADNSESWHHSLQLADAALYLAKRNGRDAWVGYWIADPIPEWPPERLGRESHLARSLGLIEPAASRPLREPLASIAS